jgi:OCT family organic cation transporter-like MFS transporter 4/5
LNWVCQNAWKSATGQSAYFVGSVFGTLLFGFLADHYGRLPVLISANLVAAFGTILTIFSQNVYFFTFSRLVTGFSCDADLYMMYILVVEYLQPEKRNFGINLVYGITHSLATLLSPWLAVWVGTWKLFLLTISVPTFLIPLLYFIVFESAQWMVLKGRVDEAVKIFRKISKINSKSLEENYIREFKNNCQSSNLIKSVKKESFLDLFKTPRLRRITIICLLKS